MLMCRIYSWITRMANDMHRAARYRGDHRFGMRCFILWREHRLVKTGNDQVQRVEHRAGTVNFALGIFDIGFDTAQDTNALHQPRPDTHINKMPVVRRIGHIGPVVGNSKEFDPLALCFCNIIVQGTVGVGAGDGMHVQVNRIHHNLLLCLWQE